MACILKEMDVALRQLRESLNRLFMKIILAAMGVWTLTGCAGGFKDIQVDMVKAKVLKLDTVFRYPEYVKQITWLDEDNTRYVSFLPITDQTCLPGMSMYILRRR